MKYLLITIVNCFLHFGGSCQHLATITLHVPGLKNNQGSVKACLFSKEGSFPMRSKEAEKCVSVSIVNHSATLVFSDVRPGKYAISLIHDENNNNELDVNFLGIPKEGIGASNNILPRMSAPKFDASSFLVHSNDALVFEIKIKY